VTDAKKPPNHFLHRVAFPSLMGVSILVALIGVLLFWAGREADDIAVSRQIALANVVIGNLRSEIAHDQESVTVWDDAVVAVGRTDSAEWIDYNLGSWMNTYFGHDGAFVLDTRNRAIYQFATIEQDEPYDGLKTVAAPLVARLREKLREGDETELSDRILSHGAADLKVVWGRPALVSAKPIISDTGDIEQEPGSEYVHLAIRFLDGDFLALLAQDYMFEDLRFEWDDRPARGFVSLPLLADSGTPIGHLHWRPHRPGAVMIGQVAPAAIAIAIMVFALIGGLLVLLSLRSKNLADREARMRHLAHHDPLTELPNRALFHQRLDEAIANRAANASVAVLYLDLDHFKQVNDTLGHPAGDAVITEFSARLTALIRPTDTLSRIGGDEFTIVMPNLDGLDLVKAVSERIIDTVRQPFVIEGHQVFIGVTIGVAVAPRDGETQTELCRKADIALYHAKSAGRGRFAIFGSEMDAMLKARRDIERDLRKALTENDQLEVHYQPLFSASNHGIIGVEALLRWRHPQNGWISPDIFIPIAEESGMIEAIGEFVLRESCGAARHWPRLSVSVNVSAVELRNPAFAAKVASRLLEAEIEPRRLELELTETALTDPNGICDQNVKALRELGVRIALDDFGTGFSSLGRLQMLDVDRIKIDRSFVNGFGRDNGDESIVEAIVGMARARGLKTTAEGVETKEQGSRLKEIGCDDLQGFLYSRPLPRQELDMLLAARRPQNRTAP
jgi:diguanylate cyclase (GGDEF)-like protein